MSISKALCLALLCAPCLAPAAEKRGYFTGHDMSDPSQRQEGIEAHRARVQMQDPEELRAAIDETQTLVGALAAESGRLDAAELELLLKDLRNEAKLPEAEKRMRKAVQWSEEIDQIQGGIKQQQQRVRDAADAATADREEERLLGLQSDLLGNVEDLRKALRSLHKDLNEAQVRDLHNWLMVSEGLLRRRREAAEEAASRQQAAEALPLDAGAVAPSPLSPSAAP